MSRVLRFRIWDKANKEYMILGATGLDARNGDVIDYYNEGNRLGGPEEYDVEQYTGLKDKNGKEIYEGDILWWEHFYGMTGENIETTAKVYWEEKDASFVVGNWFEPLGHLVDEDEVEVIGNIHENEELCGESV